MEQCSSNNFFPAATSARVTFFPAVCPAQAATIKPEASTPADTKTRTCFPLTMLALMIFSERSRRVVAGSVPLPQQPVNSARNVSRPGIIQCLAPSVYFYGRQFAGYYGHARYSHLSSAFRRNRRPRLGHRQAQRRPRQRQIRLSQARRRRSAGLFQIRRNRRLSRRLLLGHSSRLRPRKGRNLFDFRLFRRSRQNRPLRGSQHGRNRPRRIRKNRLRPLANFLRSDPHDLLFRRPQSDGTQLPGPRLRHAIPLLNLLFERSAKENRRLLHRPAQRRKNLFAAHGHQSRSAPRLLRRRGLSPGLPQTPLLRALHRHERRAQTNQPKKRISRPLSQRLNSSDRK